jgi:membrane-anchored protein YejM (alkaline phosphatase superfamily)
LTISVHHPYSFIDEGPVPEEIAKAASGHEYYRKYLSRLSYEDRALTGFFEAFFSSSLANNTVVAVVADHSSPVRPHLPLNNRQFEEMRFRVPFALVTANPKTPRSVSTPVHQVDMAPLVARLVGLEGEVTWVGRDPLAGQGSPWVYDGGAQLMFRTSRRGCYPETKKGPTRCYDTVGVDPMYATELPEIPVDSDLVAFFATVVRSNMHTIILNLARPASRN